MPDLASHTEDSVLDDDALAADGRTGRTLMVPLRNQGDSRILMDVVADRVTLSVTQERQLAAAMERIDSNDIECIPRIFRGGKHNTCGHQWSRCNQIADSERSRACAWEAPPGIGSSSHRCNGCIIFSSQMMKHIETPDS